MSITFQYLNSLDWLVFDDNTNGNVSYESQNNDFFFEINTLKKKSLFGRVIYEVPYLTITKKESNISACKTSENILQLWKNLEKWFYCERGKIQKEMVEL